MMMRTIAILLALLPSLAFGQATTPPFETKNPAALRRFLTGEEGTAFFYGDSLVHLAHWAPYQAFTSMGIKAYGQGDRFFSSSNLSGCFNGDTTVNEWSEPLDGGSWTGQVDLLGGTSNSSDTDANNRPLYIGQVGPRYRAMATAQQEQIFGRDWQGDLLDGGQQLIFDLPVRVRPDGAQNNDWRIDLKEGSTVLASSAYFNAYDAEEHWELVSTTLPSGGTSTFTFLQAELRIRNSTASENGKKVLMSAHGRMRNPAATTGQEFHFFGQGGITLEEAANPAVLPDEVLELGPLYQPKLVFLQYGFNDGSSGSIEACKTAYLQLIARIRDADHMPNAHIVIVIPYAKRSYGDRAGGENGLEPYYVKGAYAAFEETTNCTVVNMCRLMPDAGTLGGRLKKDWSSIPSGAYIPKGSNVEYSGSFYSAKTTHLKIGTVPSSDTTNWQVVTTLGTVEEFEPRVSDFNAGTYDDVHMTNAFKFTYYCSLKTALYACAYSAGSESIAQEIVDILDPPTLQEIAEGYVTLDTGETEAADGSAAALSGGGGGGTSQQRINEPPAKAYTVAVSTLTDGTVECPVPLRLPPGDTNIVFGIDMSPRYGQVRVFNVGEPTVSGGDVTATELGPHDWIAMVQLGGTVTAGERRIITVPVTMRTGETEQVRVKLWGMTNAE